MELAHKHRFQAKDIGSIEVWSFHEACRLATRIPATTEEAQYSLPFSVASVLRHGTLGAVEVADTALADPLTQHLSTSMLLHEHAPYNDVFPAERWAHVRVHLHSGVQYDSEPGKPRGNPENALIEGEILEKFFGLANPVIGSARAREIVALVAQLGQSDGAFARLMELVLAPAPSA